MGFYLKLRAIIKNHSNEPTCAHNALQRGQPLQCLPLTCPIVPMQMCSARVNGSQPSCSGYYSLLCIPWLPSFNLVSDNKMHILILPSRKNNKWILYGKKTHFVIYCLCSLWLTLFYSCHVECNFLLRYVCDESFYLKVFFIVVLSNTLLCIGTFII